jgi:hypothetical protein
MIAVAYILQAYAGFSVSSEWDTIATGNWGCGAFNGHKPLKSVLQWLAAAQAGRNVLFVNRNDAAFGAALQDFVHTVTALGCRVRDVYAAVVDVRARACPSNGPQDYHFFTAILEALQC